MGLMGLVDGVLEEMVRLEERLDEYTDYC